MGDLHAAVMKPYPHEVAAFGEHWCGPERYAKVWRDYLVARYEGRGDGQNVEVWCCPAPARFYTIKADARPDSLNRPQTPFVVRTGSGQAELAARIASAIADGMLDFALADREQREARGNTGHGHVYPRPDGVRARCGGPSLCAECSRDLAKQRDEQNTRTPPAEQPAGGA